MTSALYFRRCHLCLSVSHHEHGVERCSVCLKPLARFFYFNDQYATINSDLTERARLGPGQWRPLVGVSAYWSEWVK